MTKKEALEVIGDAYVRKPRPDNVDEEYTILNESCQLYEAVKDIQFELNAETHAFELDYSIMDDACTILAEIEVDDLEDVDFYESSQDTASVYNDTRLGYLNIWNQDECAEIVREFECDIATSAAVWYERQVANACEKLRDYIQSL